MRVLLTGAFGNIGRSTLDELLRQGHRVRCFDLPSPRNKKWARAYGDRMETVWGDLRCTEAVVAAVRGQDVVVHLAFILPKLSATGAESEARSDWAREINVGGTSRLLSAARAQPRPPRFIFASSYHVYGQTQHLPPPRTANDPVDPIEYYARHKIECEGLIRNSGLEWSILRFAAVFPLDLRLDPFMFDIPLDNRMEYLHTRDAGVAVSRAVESPRVWGRTWLLGGGVKCQYTYREIVQKILDGMGIGMLPEGAFRRVPFPTDWLDTAESQKVLQYQRHDLDDYVRDLIVRLGWRRHVLRLLRPLARRVLLRQAARGNVRPHKEWQGKVAVVTGASSGIGEAIARKLCLEGLRVVLVARDRDRLDQVAKQLRAQGGEVLVLAADLTEEDQRIRVFDEVRTRFGSADVLVNSAGFGWYGFGTDMPWPLAWQMLQINVAAVVRMTLLFLGDMKARGYGHIVNIGSITGSLPSQGIALYGATKSFVESFSTALYRELRGTRIRISLVKPGAVATTFFEKASALASARHMPGFNLGVAPAAVTRRVWGLLRRPARVAYVPQCLAVVTWVEPLFGWLLDRLGPLLLKSSQPVAAH